MTYILGDTIFNHLCVLRTPRKYVCLSRPKPLPIGDDVLAEVVDAHVEAVGDHLRDDVVAEIMPRLIISTVGDQGLLQDIALEDVVAHAHETVLGIAGDGGGVFGLLLEADDASAVVDLDDTELAGLFTGHGVYFVR